MSIGIVNKLDTPWGFTKDIQQDNWHIQYTNLNEICQGGPLVGNLHDQDRKSTRLNSSHRSQSRMPSSA